MTFTFLNAIRNESDVEKIEMLRYNGNWEAQKSEWKCYSETDVLYPLPEALRFAIMYGNVPYTSYILENFAEKALSVRTCCPLLMLAVRLNHLTIVELLCKHGRNVQTEEGRFYINSQGCDLMECGKTALHTAVELGHRECTKTLLKYGADHRLLDGDGASVLERGCARFHKKSSFPVLMCVLEVVKCEKQLQPGSINLLKELYESWEYPGCFTQIPLTLEVSNLMHLCRIALRDVLQRKLPNAISELPLPNITKQYLDVS